MTQDTNTASGAADLIAAAQAVVARWDTPLWKDAPATAGYIGRLRAALASAPAQPVAGPGTPAPVGVEPVARLEIGKTKGGVSLTHIAEPAAFQLREGMYALYTTPQHAQAQAGAVPLTDEWIRSRCKESWIFDTAKQWVRMTEAAHGITHKEGGQHAD